MLLKLPKETEVPEKGAKKEKRQTGGLKIVFRDTPERGLYPSSPSNNKVLEEKKAWSQETQKPE